MMGILDRLEQRARIENPRVPLSASNILEALGMEMPTPAGVNITHDKALGITAFWAGVRAISQTIAGLPLQVYEKTGEKTRRQAPEHPVYNLLFKRPNPYMSAFTFKEMRAAHLLCWGNSYAEIQRNERGQIVALWPLLPDRTGAEIRGGQKFYYTHIDGTKIWLSADKVLHVPGLGFDGIQGYNVIKIHRDSLGLSVAANEYGAQFFGNAARPSGILVHPGKPSEQEKQEFRESWNQVHAGLTRAQRTAIMWGGMKWEKISMAPEEAQFLQTREMQIEEVARILNINPILLQHFTKATTWGSGVAQFLVAYGKFTIAPWLERDEDAMDWDLFSEAEHGRYYVKYNLDSLLRGDAEVQAKVLEIKRRNGIINADEWRELDDENPLPDGLGQEYFMPLNMVPVSQMIERPTENLPMPKRNLREKRASTLRKRLREAHLPIIEDGVRRYVKRDAEALKKAARRAAQEVDPQAYLDRWVREFYPGQQDYIHQTMFPLVLAMATAIATEASDEVGVEPREVDAFALSYTDNFAAREAGSSRGQVLQIMKETQAEELEEVLTARANEWSEKRPGKVAANEVVRLASGAARFAWVAAGLGAVWAANPGACPICQEMDGRRVSSKGMFASAGDIVKSPDEDTDDLVVEYDLAGPPLHKGCVCDIVPG